MAEVGLAGTMVAAVLETAGYYYQSQILDQLGEAFTGSLGGLIYAVGVAATVFAVAIRGGYKFGPWLLIGPPLFFSMVVPRTAADNTLWQFAGQPRDQNQVQAEVARLVPPGDAEVSTLFAKYNRLVSRTVQEMVRVINREKTQSDKWFIYKGQLLSQVYSRNVDNPGLQQLIQHSLLYDCAEFVQAASESLQPDRDPTQTKMRQDQLAHFDDKKLTLTSKAAEFVAQMNREFPGRFGTETEVAQIVGDKDQKGRTYSCKDVWDYTLLGLVREGFRTVEDVTDQAERRGLDKDEVLNALAKAIGQAKDGAEPGSVDQAEHIQKIALAAAKYILRNESAHRSFAGMMEDQAQRSLEAGTVEIPAQNELSQTEFARGRSTEYAERTRMLTIGTSLPYYQGLILFLLAIAFPFFALLLLVPGKHAGFLLWFALWLWIKSWDIGMAIVMQLDDVIFTVLNLAKEFRTSDLQKEAINFDFVAAVSALRLSDPTFQLATYYNVIGACLMAIPIVSSQLLLGSLSGGVGVISQGMKVMSEDFASASRVSQSQLAVSNLRHDIIQLGVDRANNYFKNGGGFTENKVLPDGRNVRHADLKRNMSTYYAEQHVQYGPSTHSPDGRVVTESNRRMDHTENSIQNRMALFQTMRVAEGLTRAFSGSSGIWSGKSDNPGLTAARSSGFTAVADSAAALATFYQKEAEGQMDPLGKWAWFDAVYSERGKRLAAESRIWGQLEVPQTADSPELFEQRLDRSLIEMEANLEAELLGSWGKATSSAAKPWFSAD